MTHLERQRSCGRIGGFVGLVDGEALTRLRVSLGPGAQILESGPTHAVIADWDCCWIGNDRVASLEQWKTIIEQNRLGDVIGAFVVAWKDSSGIVRIARDAIGERTLFYAKTSDGWVFGATIYALLATGLVERRINLVGVATYLSYAYLPGQETLIRGISELLPGEVVELRPHEVIRTQFWRLPPEAPPGQTDEETLRRQLRNELEQAVIRRLPPGEPVGAFLSGGLDSSLVVALARRLHEHPVRTFSLSFGEGYANELPFSSLVAEHCRTDHTVVELSPQLVLDRLDETIAMLSDPIGDPLTVPNAVLFQAAAAEVGAVLNGEGGDPCFGGPKNLPMLLAELFVGAPVSSGDVNLPRERSYLRAHLKCYDDLKEMLSEEARGAIAGDLLELRLSPWFADPRWPSFVSKLMAMNVTFKGAHHILPKVDAISAPFGVTPRSPLFDRAVVEQAFAIPPQLKLRGSVEKYLLKQAVRDLLPETILNRPKSGMLVPVEAWFQGPLLPYARERLLDGLTTYGIFERSYLERLIAGQLGGVRPRRGAKIWLLVTLEAWLRCVAK